ncbi:Carboxypeptidase D [Handroanthus impetiginosus]|uniref:Carboxypeptidase D n=1 Tax=Handroanthus impetiginosus TaxID=429701 RepID=A0A2G9HSG1_9LAMI|nr:Carboxypeptidase D [Handroanthus impetiginosus]
MAKRTFINLKGIAIGNAYIDYADHITGVFDHFWMSALLSDQTYLQIVQICNFSSPSSASEVCKAYLDQAFEEIGPIYLYNIYEPFCSSSPSFDTFSFTGFDPCSFHYVIKYLNTPEVQKALHANGTWDSCNYEIGGKWQDSPNTVLPLIKKLMATGIRIWIYSGDTDGLAPVTATKYSMPKLGSPVKTSWYPWYSRGQVGGYVVGYANVTFVSVRGAGHFVPSYQPARALDLISSFLKGKLPPGLE